MKFRKPAVPRLSATCNSSLWPLLKVRQFSRGSTDGGKTWTVEYDFTYTRKK
jgi:hypothetical protein